MHSTMKNSHKLQTTHHGEYLRDMFVWVWAALVILAKVAYNFIIY